MTTRITHLQLLDLVRDITDRRRYGFTFVDAYDYVTQCRSDLDDGQLDDLRDLAAAGWKKA